MASPVRIKDRWNEPRTLLIQSRIEETDLYPGAFDIVHSCHTIEHLAEPFAALKDHARVLRRLRGLDEVMCAHFPRPFRDRRYGRGPDPDRRYVNGRRVAAGQLCSPR